MLKIIVTGSKGQLGQEIQVISKDYIGFEFHFHDIDTLDITDEQAISTLFNAIKPAYVINCAAYTAVDKAETDEDLAFAINSKAAKIITDGCKAINARLIHISTDYVFDGSLSSPLKETDPVNPMGVYGKSKLGGELLSLLYDGTLVIRTAWLYSSFGNNFVKTVLRLGKERDTLTMISDQVGTPTYAADLAVAIMQIIEQVENKSTKFVPGLFHFSNEGACSWFDFASEIVVQSGLSCRVKPIPTSGYPTPAKRPPYSIFSKEKIKETYHITIPWWKDSLSRCLTLLR